jgi:hypothetical protein
MIDKRTPNNLVEIWQGEESPPINTAINTNNAAGDAFGRLRVSNPVTLYAQKFIYGKSDGTFFSEELSGSALSDHDPANSCIDMAVFDDGDYAIRQSRQRINYQAGKSQLFKMTGVLEPEAGTEKRIGCFQGGTTSPFAVLDGICFESVGTDMYLKIYKGGVEVDSAIQSAWKDPLDGSGDSGVVIDWSKTQIFIIDYQWLGVGRVRFGLGINGVTYYIHEFNHANVKDQVYMRSPNQPIRYEIRSTGGAGSLKQICCAVDSEGGQEPSGLVAAIRSPAAITVGNADYELIKSLRLKPDELDATIILEKVNIIAPTSGDYEYVVCWNPIIAGTVNWVDVPGASIQEADGDGTTNNVIPTIVIDAGYGSSDMDNRTDLINSTLRLGSKIDGTQDVIALAVKTETTTESFKGSLTIRQLI